MAAPDRAPDPAATLFDLAPPPAAPDEPPPATPLAPLLAYAEDLEARVEARLAELHEAAAAARAAAGDDEDAGRRLVAEAGFDHSRALEARLAEIRAVETAAGRERSAAQRQLAPTARLDGLLARADELRSGFEALKDVLADRAFVGFVVARRQTALLAHASQVLVEITGRYAFTEDFRILDNESGLPRSPDTLSGGETFLASLALALGLVEVADRSGGDLRALFLDEGFGTLDAAVLDMALSTLEERARAGRLIGLISHVPTVAERIETVLEVTSTVEGSTVERLGDAQRAERVLEADRGGHLSAPRARQRGGADSEMASPPPSNSHTGAEIGIRRAEANSSRLAATASASRDSRGPITSHSTSSRAASGYSAARRAASAAEPSPSRRASAGSVCPRVSATTASRAREAPWAASAARCESPRLANAFTSSPAAALPGAPSATGPATIATPSTSSATSPARRRRAITAAATVTTPPATNSHGSAVSGSPGSGMSYTARNSWSTASSCRE